MSSREVADRVELSPQGVYVVLLQPPGSRLFESVWSLNAYAARAGSSSMTGPCRSV